VKRNRLGEVALPRTFHGNDLAAESGNYLVANRIDAVLRLIGIAALGNQPHANMPHVGENRDVQILVGSE